MDSGPPWGADISTHAIRVLGGVWVPEGSVEVGANNRYALGWLDLPELPTPGGAGRRRARGDGRRPPPRGRRPGRESRTGSPIRRPPPAPEPPDSEGPVRPRRSPGRLARRPRPGRGPDSRKACG